MTHILRFPVYTLDNSLMLPAGTPFSKDTLESLISSVRKKPVQYAILLYHGSLKKDMLSFIEHSSKYSLIFEGEKRKEGLLKIMEQVSLPVPVMESLDYFKQYDTYTYRHILMVFALSTLLARDFISDSQDLVQGISAGPVHDFGKICVPLDILRKTGPLTQNELEWLKHHTIAGKILLSYYFQDTCNFSAKVAGEHHERLDGSGYPDNICLKDRMIEIIAVSDVYDALISLRPYRPVSYDNRTALEEITNMAEQGKLSFEVVRALVANNRKSRPHYTACVLSSEKRGVPPPYNVYGVIADEDKIDNIKQIATTVEN